MFFLVSWVKYPPIFCYPIWRIPSNFLPRTFVTCLRYFYTEGTEVSAPTIFPTCSCFIAQLALNVWHCGKGKAFWNSLKNKKIKNHKKLERRLGSPQDLEPALSRFSSTVVHSCRRGTVLSGMFHSRIQLFFLEQNVTKDLFLLLSLQLMKI